MAHIEPVYASATNPTGTQGGSQGAGVHLRVLKSDGESSESQFRPYDKPYRTGRLDLADSPLLQGGDHRLEDNIPSEKT